MTRLTYDEVIEMGGQQEWAREIELAQIAARNSEDGEEIDMATLYDLSDVDVYDVLYLAREIDILDLVQDGGDLSPVERPSVITRHAGRWHGRLRRH